MTIIVGIVCFIIGTLQIAVTQRGLEGGQCGYGLAVALQLGLPFLIGCLDSGLDLLDGLHIRLGDDEACAVLGGGAIDAGGFPNVLIRQANNAGDNLC